MSNYANTVSPVETPEKTRLAIVVSRFNEPVTEALLQGALAQADLRGIPSAQVSVFSVPGAVEIPLVAQRLARSQKVDAIVCLGAVIRGETTHYDYVCQQVSSGCQQVALNEDLPVVFGVLTTENKAQAMDRCGGNHGHKGKEAIDVAIEMLALLSQISTSA